MADIAPSRGATRALQILVAIGGLVPVSAGLGGVLLGERFLALGGPAAAQTHAAYLSGLLLGIGLAFWSTIPRIAHRGARFGLLTAIVFAGGLSRLYAAIALGAGGTGVWLPLVMELGVTPALWLWQRRIARP